MIFSCWVPRQADLYLRTGFQTTSSLFLCSL